MTLRFFAYYRDPEYAGCREMTWHGAATLRELGDQLCAKLGSPFADEFWCSIFGPQADLVFLSGEIVAVALRHSVSGNNGNIFNDVTVSGIEKL